VAEADRETFPGEPEPVTVTKYVREVVEAREHCALAVLFGVRTKGLVGQVILRLVGLALPAKATLPAKLNLLVTVTFTDTPVCPTLRFAPTTLTTKSPAWTITVEECDAVPGEPRPVIVTAYVPGVVAANEQLGCEVLFCTRLTGDGQVIVRPAAETPVRPMLPAKLKVLFIDR
jgi:hypothetical protein